MTVFEVFLKRTVIFRRHYTFQIIGHQLNKLATLQWLTHNVNYDSCEQPKRKR
jgi:hypothetical protein